MMAGEMPAYEGNNRKAPASFSVVILARVAAAREESRSFLDSEPVERNRQSRTQGERRLFFGARRGPILSALARPRDSKVPPGGIRGPAQLSGLLAARR